MKSIIRSVCKTITYRILAAIITICVSYIVTNDLKISLTVGGGDMVIKSLIYFLHERAWDNRGLTKQK